MERRNCILVVEDEPLSREMLSRRLVAHGFDLIEASSGAEGRQRLESEPPDIVLLDVMLGDENGIDLLRWIRSRWNAERLPVILVTAMAESEDVVRGLEAGANDYVVKPINLPILLARISVHLKIRHSAALLEERVAARTAELQQLNETLRQEIGERRRAEAELRESEARYHSLAENSPVGIFHTDPAGKCVYVNRRWSVIAGLSSEEAMGDGWSRSLHPDDRERVYESWQRAAESGTPFEAEFRFDREGRGDTWVIVRAVHTDRDVGGPEGIVGTVTDISELKRREFDTQRRQRELIQAEKMVSLGTLVAGVAHEINNPCHVVMSSTASLRQFWTDALQLLERYQERERSAVVGAMTVDEIQAYVPKLFDALTQSADRIRHIVQELRDFTRENAWDADEPVVVNAVVESGITLVSNMIRKSTDHLTLEYGAELPPVRGDYRRLEQVVINLVQNACRALRGSQDGITIRTYYEGVDSSVRIEVQDEGVGIETANLSRITDPFFTTYRDKGGTGLGLSIATTIVHEHGGRLEFDSAPGRGTIARVVLPVMVGAGGRVDASDATSDG